MGVLNIKSNGRTGSLTFSVSYTPSGTSATGSLDPKFAFLYVRGRGGQVARLPAVSSSAGPTGTATFSSSNIDLKFLRDCSSCNFPTGSYNVVVEYTSPVDGYRYAKKVDTGSVVVSGPTGCTDCQDTPPDSGGEPPSSSPPQPPDPPEYGAPDAGDSLPPRAAAPADPCLPPAFVAPAPSVPTPCSGGSGGGGSSTPGFN